MAKNYSTSDSTFVSTASSNDEKEEKSAHNLEKGITAERSSLFQRKYKCRYCGKDVKTEMLLDHELGHKLTFTIKDICSKKFVLPDSLKAHAKRMHDDDKPFKCNYCTFCCETVRLLLNHMISKHNEKYKELGQIVLPEPGESSGKISSKRKRLTISSADIHSPTKATKPGSSNNPKPSGENIHESAHDLEKDITTERSSLSQSEYLCKYCGKVCKTENLLCDHIFGHKLTFTMKDICSKKFILPKSLKEHAMRKHSDNEPFKCNYCTRCFKIVGLLLSHMMSEHNEKYKELGQIMLPEPGESSGEISTKRQSSIKSADIHSPMKDPKPGPSSNPRPSGDNNSEMILVMIPIKVRKEQSSSYLCRTPGCRERFTKTEEFQRHSLEQHNRSFLCKYCYRTYKNDNMRIYHQGAHVLSAILTPGWEKSHGDVRELAISEHQDKKGFECKYCLNKKTISTISKLHEHVFNSHRSDAPTFCTCCKLWFENQEQKSMHPYHTKK